MEKTAMQILIDEMQMMKSEINNKESWVIKTIDVVTQRATELLEKERKVTQDYARFAIECDRKGMPILEFQDWVKWCCNNETFNQNKER